LEEQGQQLFLGRVLLGKEVLGYSAVVFEHQAGES
jgi:hypothetical protein